MPPAPPQIYKKLVSYICTCKTLVFFLTFYERMRFLFLLVLKISINQSIGLVGRVFTNGLGDRGSIPGQVIVKKIKK